MGFTESAAGAGLSAALLSVCQNVIGPGLPPQLAKPTVSWKWAMSVSSRTRWGCASTMTKTRLVIMKSRVYHQRLPSRCKMSWVRRRGYDPAATIPLRTMLFESQDKSDWMSPSPVPFSPVNVMTLAAATVIRKSAWVSCRSMSDDEMDSANCDSEAASWRLDASFDANGTP